MEEAYHMLLYNLRLPLWLYPEEARKQILSIWDKAEVIKVIDNEQEFFTENNDIDDAAAMSLWHHNLKLILVTLCDHGYRYYTKNFKGTVDAFKDKALDSTGVDDSFVGALLSNIEARKQILSIWDKAEVIKGSDNELEFLSGNV